MTRHRSGRLDGRFDFSILITKELSFEDALMVAEDVARRSNAVGIHRVVGRVFYEVWREPEDKYDISNLRRVHGEITAKSCAMIWDKGLLIKNERV